MLSLPGVRLLEQVRHRRKLKVGTHRANRFELRLCEVSGDAQDALRRIRACGVPNYFGEQRFGHGGRNVALALALFRGTRLRRDRRSVALSAARAVLFNSVLAQRVADGSWDRLQSGDIAILDGSHSHFAISAPDETLQARCAAFDLHPSGPLWGRGGSAGPADAALQHALATWPELAAGLERHAAAARRALRVRPADLQWQAAGETLELRFTLPAGAFATAVLREAVDYRDAAGAG